MRPAVTGMRAENNNARVCIGPCPSLCVAQLIQEESVAARKTNIVMSAAERIRSTDAAMGT